VPLREPGGETAGVNGQFNKDMCVLERKTKLRRLTISARCLESVQTGPSLRLRALAHYWETGVKQQKKSPKAGSVEALYEVAKQEEQSKEVSKEEAIRQVLRAPKKAPEKDKKEEPEYENFQEEIKDIGPKILSYAKALLVLPLTYWPYIVGLVAITALTVFLSDGSFGTRAPPMDM